MPKQDHPRSSRRRYQVFVNDYHAQKLDEKLDAENAKRPLGEAKAAPVEVSRTKRRFLGKGKQRKYVGDYLRWLKPHRYGIATVFVLALITGGAEMIQPLFMRYIIDHVLLNKALDTAGRFSRLQFAGGTYLAVVIITAFVQALKDYRQRILNVRVVLSLRRSLFARFPRVTGRCWCRA